MKKVLFATTALVATAGVASAEVAISGGAEMGLQGGDLYGPADDAAQFLTSVDVRFTMTGETDGGLQFGATVDADDIADMGLQGNDPVDNVNGQFADYTVFISGDFGTFTIGDTDGAYDRVLTENFGNPGSIGDEETGHNGYNGGNNFDGFYDGQIARYDYSFDAFSVAVSVEISDFSDEYVFQLGGAYEFDFSGGSAEVGLAYAYDSFTEDTLIGMTAGVMLDSGFEGGIMLEQFNDEFFNGTFDGTYVGLSAGYSVDAISVGVNYGVYDSDFFGESAGFGLAAAYDLGGGAAIHFGYGTNTEGAGDGDSGYSFGLAMSF
ncbi:porin [Maritalea mobilis]|uniref:porin n=1 Tax=Maritalea mobilis TaxID=483324 RepID=UPI001C988112|nr:porin [Maritalea mobilis]MBY6202965.1 porin [Maritalea mobilis]